MTEDGMDILLAMLYANYPGQIKNAETTRAIWMKVFGNISEEALTEAVFAHMERSDFAPKISDIMDMLPQPDVPRLEQSSRQKRAVYELKRWHEDSQKRITGIPPCL